MSNIIVPDKFNLLLEIQLVAAPAFIELIFLMINGLLVGKMFPNKILYNNREISNEEAANLLYNNTNILPIYRKIEIYSFTIDNIEYTDPTDIRNNLNDEVIYNIIHHNLNDNNIKIYENAYMPNRYSVNNHYGDFYIEYWCWYYDFPIRVSTNTEGIYEVYLLVNNLQA